MPVTLPTDAIDQILNHVENPSDILNVALSNQSLYSVAVPQHLHYRDIRTRLQNLPLWTSLSRLDDLRASHIRSLTILPDQEDFYEMKHSYDFRERLPPDFIPSARIPMAGTHDIDACRKSEASLVSALKRMSSLESFRWFRIPRPLLVDPDNIWTTLQSLGTVKELDIYDGWIPMTVEPPPVVVSDTFLRFKDLTVLKIRSDYGVRSLQADIPPEFEAMLLNNLPNLEVLALELNLDRGISGTANIDNILSAANWLKLRVLRLCGLNSYVIPLIRFLIAHPTLEELSLARMTPGHLWTRLQDELPSNALPNLRLLECSSSQAAALLKDPRPKLKTLLGLELHNKIVDSEYFDWDDEWEDEVHEDYDEDQERESPWKAVLLERLKTQSSISHLGLDSLRSAQEMEELSVVAPQITEIDIQWNFNTEWNNLPFALFQSLEVLSGPLHLTWFDETSTEKTNTQIQHLAKVFPRLKLVIAYKYGKKILILREANEEESRVDGVVRWILREWGESEDMTPRDGERVYGV